MHSRRLAHVVVLAAGAFALAAPLIAQDQAPAAPPVRKLELSFSDKGVTLVAQNVSVREVLAEWGRKCDCTMIGLDKITDARLQFPVQYENQPEDVVIKSLLNPNVAGGYMFTAREEGQAGASRYASVRMAAVSKTATVLYNNTASTVQLTTNEDEQPPVQRVPIVEAPPPPPAAAPTAPTTPALPPGVLPTTGVNPTNPAGRGRGAGPGGL